jgi:hypothetical protein
MPTLNISIPEEQVPASQFVTSLIGLKRDQREEAFLKALVEGHVPDHMRAFVDVGLTFVDKQGTSHKLVISVLPDYLMVGVVGDALRVPLWPLTAQKVADAWGCVLPTPKLVTLLWHAAESRLPPQPWGPPYDETMMSTTRIVEHNKRIEKTIKDKGVDATKLVAGHKKDVVLTNKLVTKPNQVAIFGWHQLSSKNIQPLYLGHGADYADYSHGIRLISQTCMLDDVEDSLPRIMQDPNLHVVVSDEGPLKVLRQPGVQPQTE